LLLAPQNKWWPYFVIAVPIRFIPALHEGTPQWFVAATSVNDMLKAALGAYLLRRVVGRPLSLSTLREFAIYLAIVVVLTPMLSAFGGAASRRVLGFEFWPAWNEWFAGDALANLVLTPALFYWCSRRFAETRPRLLEVLLWTSGLAASLFYTVTLGPSSYLPIALYAPIPFLLWAATRFGPIGASTTLSLIALLSMVGIAKGQGLFSVIAASHSLLFVQLFLAVVSVPVLFVAILIEERSAVEKQLRDSEEELNDNYHRVRDLAGKLINAQEDERRRIALELHDDISQRMALLSIRLDDVDRELPAGVTKAHDDLAGLKRQTEEVARAVHDLSHQLHSSILQNLGLSDGLRGLCRTVAQQHRVVVDLDVDGVAGLPDDVSLCLYRVAQEALNNAVRHGRAKQVWVQLRQDGGLTRLEIEDAGTGFNPAAARSNGLGLVSMQERLRMVGGTLTLTSSAGHGTVIEAVVGQGLASPGNG
jgi:two-component system sensor histidine kinase UhpB